MENAPHYLTVGWKLAETTPITGELIGLVGCTVTWKEVDYAKLIRWTTQLGLMVADDGENSN